ncbi:rad4 transglutaminase-like domain-containing protein [Sarocladium implicatum]|nr:rad4 transglutaminase-like domain-containing protein [Sarocladium implicatum]
MPPLVPRKRLRETPPPETEKKKANGASTVERRKPALFENLDVPTTNHLSALLQASDAEDSLSSLSSLSEDEFEDVPPPKRQKNSESEDEDDLEFEDVEAPAAPAPEGPVPTGDLELTLHRDTRVSLINPFGEKKGPTKRERKVRNAAHCLHVMSLLWHNSVRNAWLCDPEVQATMLSHLSPKLWEQVDRWRRSSGLVKEPPPKPPPKAKGKGKLKSKGNARKGTVKDEEHRDWGTAAERLEEGAIDMSHGDPLFRLMQYLAPWWRKRFRVNSPGIRKMGYMSLERLDRLLKAYKAEEHDSERFGERIDTVDDLRRAARECHGSRDVGAQLFTALLRGLGIESRMVANLQVLGYGWTKIEEADPEAEEEDQIQKLDGAKDSTTPSTKAKQPPAKRSAPSKPKSTAKSPKAGTGRQVKEPIVVDDTDDLGFEHEDTDDESVVELEVRSKRPPPVKRFDTDLEYPHYWTEVLSPVTKKYLPVEPISKCIIATNRELTESLEPRGAKADKAKQIMAYIVGYSKDGTAKDVTVRYLKRQLMPGRTKGVRLPPEKVPVYGRNGKVKRYEMSDWFKTAMSVYGRGGEKFPITEVDHQEDATDLKAAQPEKKQVKEGEETLQYYKQSKEFVLERHLKREEVLKPGARPVKTFKNKAKGGKVEEEDVYLRSDVLTAKSQETWHKQGRAPKPGEHPLKRVPYRAATLNRKRELLEIEAQTGHKVLQGLFSYEQTEWIIPPPIRDGVIPKNDYGNIDLFAEHMCPQGAVHVPFRGAVKVCKRLQIDYAEAVVDFEFGRRMAVPVIQGVVIAEEYHDQVIVELEKDEAERARKEDEKRRTAALAKWRKFLKGMRIVERIRQDYGEIDQNISVFGHSSVKPFVEEKPPTNLEDGDMAGGFLPEGYEEEDEDEEAAQQTSSFFPVTNDDDEEHHDDDLIMEDYQQEPTKEAEAEEEEATSPTLAPEEKPVRKRGRPPKAKPSAPAAPPEQSRGTRRSGRQIRQRMVVHDEESDEDGDDEE